MHTGTSTEGMERRRRPQPRREASEESNTADTLISDFEPPGVGENYLGFKLLVCGTLSWQPELRNITPKQPCERPTLSVR